MGIEVVSNCFLIHIFCTLTSLYRGSAWLCPKLNNMMYRLPKFCRTYRLFLENDLPAPYCDGFMEYIQYSTMEFSNFSNNKIKSINFVKLLDLENFVLFLQNRVWLGSKHNFEDPIIANNIEKVQCQYTIPIGALGFTVPPVWLELPDLVSKRESLIQPLWRTQPQKSSCSMLCTQCTPAFNTIHPPGPLHFNYSMAYTVHCILFLDLFTADLRGCVTEQVQIYEKTLVIYSTLYYLSMVVPTEFR